MLHLTDVIVCWTGGSKPGPYPPEDPDELRLCDALLSAQCAAYQAFWGEEPPADIKAQYLVSARYDAHATIRYQENTLTFEVKKNG